MFSADRLLIKYNIILIRHNYCFIYTCTEIYKMEICNKIKLLMYQKWILKQTQHLCFNQLLIMYKTKLLFCRLINRSKEYVSKEYCEYRYVMK